MCNLSIVKIAICLSIQLSCLGLAQERDATQEELVKQLEDTTVQRRRDAVYELVSRAEHSDMVIAAFGKASSDSDTQVRVQSLTGLARAGKKSEPVISELLKCLGHRDGQVRLRAAGALGAIGTASIAPLTTTWESASNDAKIAAAQAFAIIGPEATSAIPMLTAGLNGTDGLPRYAAEALVTISPQDEVGLLKIAENSDAAARKVGINGLALLALPSESAMKRIQNAAGDSDPKIRETAIVVVAKSQLPNAEKSALIEAALVDSVASVRAAAIVAMMKAALPTEEFAMRVAARLQSINAETACAVVKALSMLGPSARVTLPALVKVTSMTGIDQQLLAKTMANFGAVVVPDLFAAIEQHPEYEQVYSKALGLIGEPAVEALTHGMKSNVELVRVAATRALGDVRPVNTLLLQKLKTAIEDGSAKVREIAVTSLIAVAKEADFSKEAILNATKDVDSKVRAAAMQSLVRFKFTDTQSQQTIEMGLIDPSADVRTSSLTVLSEMPQMMQAYSDQVASMVKDPDANVRAKAVQTLGKLGKNQISESVVESCATALRDGNYAVRIAATESVKSLGISQPAILDALEGNLIYELSLLRMTIETVSGFGDKSASLIPVVAHLATHEKVEIRADALNALAVMEKDSRVLVRRLVAALDDKEWEVRRIAGGALGKLGAEAKSAVPKLFQLLSNDEDRDFASSSLKEINTAPLEAIPLLMEKLESEERRTAFYAVTLLGKIGPSAAEALPKLEEMLAKQKGEAGRSEFRRKFLVEAIAAIKGESPAKASGK